MHAHDDIAVNDELIQFAEKNILPNSSVFDKDRCEYLKDFTTGDLKAVPGAGKTTLLLAKLIIIEKSLPLRSGKAVLVLSHTNTAVNEINLRIKKFCPKLFSYPNHIGTIQSFVNRFLAIPYFESTMNIRVNSIDDEYYHKLVEMKYSSMPRSELKSWLEKQYDPIGLLKKLRFNNNWKLVYYVNGSPDSFPLKNESTKTYKNLVKFKMDILKRGILHYDDAYFLANRYLIMYPEIINILRKRFGFVFIDEMQDMDIHQYKILEIFKSDDVCFQRLGDNNQAIYNSIIHSDNIWSMREHTRTINGSYRLTTINAAVSSRLGLDDEKINGLNVGPKTFKPIMTIFNDEDIECNVIQTFSNHLTTLLSDDSELNNKVNCFKVVSWRKEHDKGYLSLQKYCPKYLNMKENSIVTETIDLPNYKLVKQIIDSIGDICFREVTYSDDMIITKNNLKKILYSDAEKKENVERYIYKLVIDILLGKVEKFNNEYNLLLKYILESFNVFPEDIKRIVNEQNGSYNLFKVVASENEQKCSVCNICGCVPIMGTVHSVKGETHDITLFLESFYNGKFESDIIATILTGEETSASLIATENDKIKTLQTEIEEIKTKVKPRGIQRREIDIRRHKQVISNIQQYSKLVYVAMTRAKSIIGYAVSESRYEKYFEGRLNPEEWDIIFC